MGEVHAQAPQHSTVARVSLPADLFAISPGSDAAWPFVLTTWLRSYADSEFARCIRPGVFHAHHHAIAESLLRACELRLAMSTGEHGVYLGWSLRAPAPSVLHYVFVKPGFRNLGIGRALCADLAPGWRYSHRTADFRRLGLGGVYNPYLLGAT